MLVRKVIHVIGAGLVTEKGKWIKQKFPLFLPLIKKGTARELQQPVCNNNPNWLLLKLVTWITETSTMLQNKTEKEKINEIKRYNC